MDRFDRIAGNLGFAAAAALSVWLLTVEEAPAAPVCGDRTTIVSALEGWTEFAPELEAPEA